MRCNENIRSVIGLDPQTITADADGTTVKGPAIDRRGFEEALVNLQHGAVVDGATLIAKVQEADTEADADFADITGAAFANVVGGAAVTSGIYAGRLNLVGRKRYLRVVATVNGDAKTAAAAALVSLHQARELPVSQVNDLAFNVS
ncbi:MAG: hypothetical protein AB1424_01125 [Thermodesulfobacteriota bacterium]